MTPTKTESSSRQHEHVMELASSPEEVWKAITEAEELVRWFPLESNVEPGEGGHITYGWGEMTGTCKIVDWKPALHLKTTWMQAPGAEAEPSSLAVDWFLEGSAGSTRLRLVHSGFGTGKQWDDEFNGTKHGWDFELFSLKHYLEHHRGASRRSMWIRRNVGSVSLEYWNRFLQRIWPSCRLADPKVGGDLRLALSSGDTVQGRLQEWRPPHQLVVTADNWNRGLVRLGIENCGVGPQAQVWVSLWDFPESQAQALEERLTIAVEAAIG